MALTLYLNRSKWLAHLTRMEDIYPDYLPVIKGNGYGFGNEFLADTVLGLRKSRVAVGTLEEARKLAAKQFDEIVILTPIVSGLELSDFTANFVFTVGSFAQLEALTEKTGALSGSIRIVIKCQSPMKRYGFAHGELAGLYAWIKKWNAAHQTVIDVLGFSLHFPLERLNDRDKEQQISAWLADIAHHGFLCKRMFVSHLSPDTFKLLQNRYANLQLVMRVGTDLWLKEKSAYYARSRVLEIKPITRGERYGYKQKRAWRSGYLLYVAGGTANGIGLEAPVHAKGLRDRLKLSAIWLLSLFNLYLSPFSFKGKRLWFAEPPHMQTCVLKLPHGFPLPKIGEEVAVRNIRMTIATFDQQVETGSVVGQSVADY